MIETPPVPDLRRRIGRKWSQTPADVLPAWIADMDILPAPCIRAALADAVAAGDLGYGPSGGQSGVPEAFSAWAARRWGWAVSPPWVRLSPDVVGAMANCIEAFAGEGEAVVVPTPIYPPFRSIVCAAGRTLVEHPLDARGRLDMADLDRTLRTCRARVLLLCNPHNPTGRCFTGAELGELAELALRHDLIVVSDEVHADLVFAPRRHIPFASLGEEVAARTVTLNSASKAFNIAGLRTAVCVASSTELRARLDALPATRWTAFSTLGARATLAAWSDEGEAWLRACVAHLEAQRARIGARVAADLAPLRWSPPEAGYLAWLDGRDLELPVEPERFFLGEARVALSAGLDFGAEGAGWVRLNFATSAEILDEILDRMAAAIARRTG